MESETELPSSSGQLDIRFFGRFEVLIHGETLDETGIKGRKARSLLKLIAHQRNHQIVRGRILDTLWPELDETAANSQLYKAIHHIRRAFSAHNEDAADWLEITDDLIRLVPPGGLVTDVQRFEKAARAGLREYGVSDLEQAISIYTGDFLPVDRYAEWASLPREHYRQLYLDVVIALASEYEKKGRLSDAAEMLRLALDKEPTLEIAHRGLMRIFAQKGQSSRAYHQFEVCREILGSELGVNPSPETRKTLDDIREGRLREQEEIHSRKMPVSGLKTSIIGRTEECRLFETLLDNLAAGQGGGVMVCGEAGIGKTRLVREYIRMVRQREIPFFMGQSGTASENIAYGPFVNLFDDILQSLPDLEAELPVELGRLVPGFSGKGSPLPHADKLAAKSFLFAGVYRFFDKLAGQGPVVIIIEDLHAADRSSRELLAYILRHGKRLPVLVVVTIRKDEGDSLPGFLENIEQEPLRLIELAPLTYEEHIRLLHQDAGQAVVGSDTAGQIYHLAEGNPFYALELFRHYLENDLPGESGYSEQTGILPTEPLSEKIPASIRHMVRQKLEHLSAHAYDLLCIAAVIGREISYSLLESIWEKEKDSSKRKELYHALEEVIDARLIEEHGLDYSFRHALLQETIYATIPAARRKIWHRQIAERLLDKSRGREEPVADIARHYLGAGEVTAGARFLVRAGKRAERSYAHEDALRYYRKACSVVERLQDHEGMKLKQEIRERIGDVYRACGQLEKCFDAYEEAISLAEKGDPGHPDLAELHRKVAVAAIFRTDIDRSKTHLDKAFELAGDDLRSQARLFITKALHLWHLNRLEDAYHLAQKALRKARECGATAEASQACEILAMTCLPLGKWEEGLAYEKEREHYGWSPEIVVATDAHLCLWEYHVSGDQPFQQARSFIEQVAEQGSQMGDLRCVAICHYALGTMHLWRGNRHEAVEELASSIELHKRVGSPAGMAYSLARKSVLYTLTGAAGLGWQAVRGGLDYATQAAVRDHCLQRLYGVGIWNRIEAEDREQTEKLAKKSEGLLNETGACGACALELYPWLTYHYLDTGQIGQAKKCGTAVSRLAEQTGNPIGKAIAKIIESSLSVTENRRNHAGECTRQSYRILRETVPETSQSPLAYYLKRMTEQQKKLEQA